VKRKWNSMVLRHEHNLSGPLAIAMAYWRVSVMAAVGPKRSFIASVQKGCYRKKLDRRCQYKNGRFSDCPDDAK
jgi:hypothetical protein